MFVVSGHNSFVAFGCAKQDALEPIAAIHDRPLSTNLTLAQRLLASRLGPSRRMAGSRKVRAGWLTRERAWRVQVRAGIDADP